MIPKNIRQDKRTRSPVFGAACSLFTVQGLNSSFDAYDNFMSLRRFDSRIFFYMDSLKTVPLTFHVWNLPHVHALRSLRLQEFRMSSTLSCEMCMWQQFRQYSVFPQFLSQPFNTLS